MDQRAGPAVRYMLGRRPRLRRVGEAGNRYFGRQAVVGAEGLLAITAVAEGGAGVGGGGEGEHVGEVAAGAEACEVHGRDKGGFVRREQSGVVRAAGRQSGSTIERPSSRVAE